MSTHTLASVLHGPNDLRLESRPLPTPDPSSLQIAIHTTGLCGSDLHYHAHYRNGDISVRHPLTLGHESAGTVLLSPTAAFAPGDRVALEPGVPCGACARCRDGRYNICPTLRFRSSAKSVPHYDGLLAERVNHPARWCHRVPDEVGWGEAALLEPLGVAVHAVRRAGLREGATVVVFGAGAVGCLVAGVARMKGASRVVVVDVDAGRAAFAVEKGFADVRVVTERGKGEGVQGKLDDAKATAEKVAKTVVGDGPLGEVDVVFECTGAEACVQAGIYATAPGGRVLLIGMGQPIQTLHLSAAALREVDLLGVFRYANTYPEAISLISRRRPGDPDFASLVTHRFHGLNRAGEAFAMAGRTVDEAGGLVMKVVVECAAEGDDR